MQSIHKSVLVKEVLNLLHPKEDGCLLVDGTLGEGGHTSAFLEAYPKLQVIGVDVDCEIQKKAKHRLFSFGDRVSYYLGWSDDFFKNYPVCYERPSLILLDLGISMYHYVASKKGFSFNDDNALDMRLSLALPVSAGDIVNEYSKSEISKILYEYGQERYAKEITCAIINKRKEKKIESSKELASIIYDAVPAKYRHAKIHPATKSFQALRIRVNEELVRLPNLLRLSFSKLKVGGRLGVITFHSLEDRIVKFYFKDVARSCVCPPNFPICKCGGLARAKLLTKKAVCPSEVELKENNAARSAKLRVIEKIRESA